MKFRETLVLAHNLQNCCLIVKLRISTEDVFCFSGYDLFSFSIQRMKYLAKSAFTQQFPQIISIIDQCIHFDILPIMIRLIDVKFLLNRCLGVRKKLASQVLSSACYFAALSQSSLEFSLVFISLLCIANGKILHAVLRG